MRNELREVQEQSSQEKYDVERKLRSCQDEVTRAQEETEEVKNDLASKERQFKRELSELNSQYEQRQASYEELQLDRDEKSRLVQSAQQRLTEREDDVTELESQIMRLKAQTGDADTLDVIKRELSEQVSHIKMLEGQNADLRIEVKQYKKQQRAIEMVEEEKHDLENKVRAMDALQKELSETQLRKQVLEQERKSWSSYLESSVSQGEEEEVRFETPEQLAKAFLKVRIQKLSLMEQLGKVMPDMTSKDEQIYELQTKASELEKELEKLRANDNGNATSSVAGSDAKARARLERQRTLAIKEAEYLRDQLKTFDSDEMELTPEMYDSQKSKRIKELEDLVDQYRTELAEEKHDAKVAVDAPTTESPHKPQAMPPQLAGTKRARLSTTTNEDSGYDSPSGSSHEPVRKMRKLENDLVEAQTARTLAERELSAATSQIESMKSTSRTRVLELKDNPAARAEAVKKEMLDRLKAENEALLAQIEQASSDNETSSRKSKLVPQASLDRLRKEITELNDAITSKDKLHKRLREGFSSKSSEFRNIVASVLGWKMNFLSNGRVRVKSLFYKGDASQSDGGAAEGEEANSIVFDGENGTMKCSGGPKSKFASDIRPQIEHWVEGQNEIPCFLAACTLDFWEKSRNSETGPDA